MKKLKFLLFSTLFSLMAINFVSCGNDDDEPNVPGNSNLVGTWYFIEDGDIDYNDKFYFGSNGKGFYGEDDDHDTFSYTYNSDTKMLHLIYSEWDENIYLTWYGQNKVEFDYYGTYIRK